MKAWSRPTEARRRRQAAKSAAGRRTAEKMAEGRKLKAQGSNPEAPGKKQLKGEEGKDAAEMPVDSSGGEDVGKEQQSLAVLSGPPPWWKEAMQIERRENAKMTGAAVEKAMLTVNAELADLRQEVSDVRTQSQLAAAAASEAKEELRAMKVEVAKLKAGEGIQTQLQGGKQKSSQGIRRRRHP